MSVKTVAFLILAYSSILHVFTVRSSQSIFKVNLATNKSFVEMALLALAITTAAALLPFTQRTIRPSTHQFESPVLVGFYLSYQSR